MPSVNETLLDAAVSHQIGLQRYSTATVRKIIALLNRVDARLVEQIIKNDPSEVSSSWSQRRLEKLLDAVRTVIVEAYGVATGELSKDVKALAAYEAEFQHNLLSRWIPVKLDIVTPAKEQLYAAVNARPFQGRLLKDVYKDLPEAAFKRVRDTIRAGFVEGRTTDQVVREIRGTRAQNYADGILEQSRRNAESVVRTALNHTANVARNQVYKENSDLIKGVKWVSTLDARTTPICQARDGEVYPVDSGPRPPAHFGCRSTTVPVVKSWAEMGINLKEAPEGTRASMNGQVPASETYNSWLKKQPKEVQEDVLGATKAKLFRDGGLSVDRFVDRAGVEYTLDELRQRESSAFERAGL